MKQAINDNRDDRAHGGDGAFAVSLASLFSPTLVIACGYGAVLAWMWTAGHASGALARLALVVMFVAVPLVFAHAVLRAFTIRLKLLPHALQVSPGFPLTAMSEIPYSLIERMTILRGISGRITGGATLVLHLAGGSKVAVCDLKHAGAARTAIEAAASAHSTRQRLRFAPAGKGTPTAAVSAKS